MHGVKAISALTALSLLVAGNAGAQGRGGHGHGGRGEAAAPRGYERGPGGFGGPGRGGMGGGRGARAGYEGRGAFDGRGFDGPPAYPGRVGRFGAPGAEYGPRGYAPPPYYPVRPGRGGAAFAAPGGSWRRGEFLPRPYWGGAALDTRRYHLRAAPPGYGWYAIGPNGYLVQRSTGLILDTAPGIQCGTALVLRQAQDEAYFWRRFGSATVSMGSLILSLSKDEPSSPTRDPASP